MRLQQALDSTHFEEMTISADPSGVGTVSDRHLPAVIANVQDENKTFEEVLMPRYRQMIDTFRDKMWLAEKETRPFFQQLIEFVDVWDKILTNKLPRSVAVTIKHTESNHSVL